MSYVNIYHLYLYFPAGAVQGQPGAVHQTGGGGGRGDRGAGDQAGGSEDSLRGENPQCGGRAGRH